MTPEELHEIHNYIDRAANRIADPLQLHSIFDAAIEKVVKEEREACALIAESYKEPTIAEAIRARERTPK